MPISVNTLLTQIASALDANPDTVGQGASDYYMFDLDFKPALNYAINVLAGFMNQRLGSEKFTEEAMRELSDTWCFQTSKYSRIQIPDTVLSITSVYADPITDPASPTITALLDSQSVYRPDIYFISALDTAKRLSSEKFALNRGNPFSPAFALENRNLGNFAYKQMTSYGSIVLLKIKNVTHAFAPGDIITDTQTKATAVFLFALSSTVMVVNEIRGEFSDGNDLTTTSGGVAKVDSASGNIYNSWEISISPVRSKSIVAIELIKYPILVSTSSGYVDFPPPMQYFLVNLALLWIAYKQGDKTSVAGLSMEQIKMEAKNYGI